MRQKTLLVVILVLFLCIGINNEYLIPIEDVNAATEKIDFDVLVDNEVEKPAGQAFVEYSSNPAIELWHYSGGYWGYNDFHIDDDVLENNLINADKLAAALNKTITFQFDIGEEKADLLRDNEIKVFASTTKAGKKLSDLFNGKPTITLEGNKILFTGKPKFHFIAGQFNSFDKIMNVDLNVILPIVHPDYGYNRYSMWGRTNAVGYGATTGYFDATNHKATDPTGEGRLAPIQIINAQGHLKSGFNVDITNDKYETSSHASANVSVGSGTFNNGGAVSIFFDYPVKLSFYTEVNDLSAEFESMPSSVATGKGVQVGIQVSSTFKTKQENIPFKWSIKTASGKPVSTTFSGHATTELGNLADIPVEGERMVYANFAMQEEDVQITFEVNKDGKKPVETYLVNNVLHYTIKAVQSVPVNGDFDLDYNILSRKITFPLTSMAQLYLPQGSWSGNATGTLQVTNGAPQLFIDFVVKDNPAVNEPETSIVRKPTVYNKLLRTDFNDNPIGGNYLNLTNAYNPITKSGNVNYSGIVSRDYIYEVSVPPCTPRGGCSTQTITRTALAAFNEGPRTNTINTFVYNGRNKLSISNLLKEKLEYTGPTQSKPIPQTWSADLKWINELHKFNVIRWMYHMDDNDNLYNPTVVNGQYERNFTAQASGEVDWKSIKTMEVDYAKSRAAAKSRNYEPAERDNAVFASDVTFKNEKFPIKSGYYFNPVGEYTFTVETVTFKPEMGKTEDHSELVDAITNSFKYESNLMYIDKDKKAVNLLDEPLASKGNSFYSKNAVLTAQNSVGINGYKLLTVHADYDLISQTNLEHSQDPNGNTHKSWKENMEGHSESLTLGSKDNFKYTEHVKDGEKMYRIEEKTTVTIIVKPPTGTKIYTHIHMPNGNYTVKATLDKIDLTNMNFAYSTLGVLSNELVLDAIPVSVKGTMYDDITSD